jgi:hypothetical protein
MLLLAQPMVHMWENVPTILEPRNAGNLNFLGTALREVGYEHYYGRLSSADFGHPTTRERAFGVCVNYWKTTGGAPAAQERARLIFEFARLNLTCDVIPLPQILLQSADVHVLQDVAHLQSVKEPHMLRVRPFTVMQQHCRPCQLIKYLYSLCRCEIKHERGSRVPDSLATSARRS